MLLLLPVEPLAGHLLAAAPMWRIVLVSSMITKAAAGWSWGLGIKNLSFVMRVAQSSSLRHARARRRGQSASWAAHHPHAPAQGELLYVIFRVDQLVLHLENGLLKIFLSIGVRLVGAGSELLA